MSSPLRGDLTRSLTLLGVGLGYLICVFFGMYDSPIFIAAIAVLPVAIVVIGFFYTLPNFCGVLLPPVVEGQPGFSVDGVAAQPFPQGITYRIFMKKLWLLAVVPMISFVLWSAISLGWIKGNADNPLPLYGSMVVLGLSFWIAARWRHERTLLRMNGTTLAFIQGITRSQARYEFFDQRGERRGGTERFFVSLVAGMPAPIMVDLRNPDCSRLFASFWFARFQVADSRHISPESLVRREGG